MSMKKALQVWIVGGCVIAIAFTFLAFCPGGIINCFQLLAVFLVSLLSVVFGGIWFFFVFALFQEAQDDSEKSEVIGDTWLVPGDPLRRQRWERQ